MNAPACRHEIGELPAGTPGNATPASAAALKEYVSLTTNRTALCLNSSEYRRREGGNGLGCETPPVFDSDMTNFSFQRGILPPSYGVRQSWAIAMRGGRC